MSFFGGGTDMPEFFNEHSGAVISTTFDKYCYVNVRHMPPFHPYISELVHNRFERVNNIGEIEHPLIRECMRLHDIHEIRLTYEGDLPARTGLGTSSTFAVGMLKHLDKKGRLPKSIIEASPFHTSAFITNVGSIGIDSIYHHIYNFGTTSLFFAMDTTLQIHSDKWKDSGENQNY